MKPSSLGDVIHALPVLHGLRVRYPSAHLAWLVSHEFREMVEHHPDLDEWIGFDRRGAGKWYRSPSAVWNLFGLLIRLWRSRFDLVVDLQGLFRSGFFSFCTGAPVRVGVGRVREGAWLFHTHRAPPPADDTHAVEANWAVARMLGFERAALRFDLGLDGEVRSWAADRLGKLLGSASADFIAVVPGGRWETKQWQAERFTQLMDRLRDLDRRCVLLGGPSEAALCEAIQAKCRETHYSLAGQTGLRQLAAILERARVVVCHDSAPMHMAAALGRPLVAIFGPTNPRRTGPYGAKARVLQRDIPCAPCYLRTLAQCPHEHRCMKELSVDEVLSAVVEAWERSDSGEQSARPG